METLRRFFFLFSILITSSYLLAEPISGSSVVLQVLDKVTARISTIEILIGENQQFGSLDIQIYECKKRPPEEIPEDFVLMRIMDQVNKKKLERVFQGWMLSSSPTVSPLEHPTYDIWVKDCKIDIDSE